MVVFFRCQFKLTQYFYACTHRISRHTYVDSGQCTKSVALINHDVCYGSCLSSVLHVIRNNDTRQPHCMASDNQYRQASMQFCLYI